MVAEKKTILLWARGRKYGVPALEDDYLLVRDFILEILKKEKVITLTSLIERSQIALSEKISGDLGWYVLHVKQDMETKNQIKTTQIEGKRRVQLIRLKRTITISTTGKYIS